MNRSEAADNARELSERLPDVMVYAVPYREQLTSSVRDKPRQYAWEVTTTLTFRNGPGSSPYYLNPIDLFRAYMNGEEL